MGQFSGLVYLGKGSEWIFNNEQETTGYNWDSAANVWQETVGQDCGWLTVNLYLRPRQSL